MGKANSGKGRSVRDFLSELNKRTAPLIDAKKAAKFYSFQFHSHARHNYITLCPTVLRVPNHRLGDIEHSLYLKKYEE